tara:strand:+ start:730 stop:2928 length:2199 start_codon:yes stop_codon:yes gene_type:complete
MDFGRDALRALRRRAGFSAADPDPSGVSEDKAVTETKEEKWLLFTDGDESTAWLQVLYGLGFANDLDYDKHNFYFVQYQHRGESTPKLVLFGVKRPPDMRDTKIEKITDVNVTSTLLQSLQRSDYFQHNLSNSAQIGINVLLSAYNMRPNDMSRELNSLIMEKGEGIQSFIQENFFAKIQDQTLEEAEQWSHYDNIDEYREIDEFEREVFDKLAPYVKVHMPPERLTTRLQAMAVSDDASAATISDLKTKVRKYEDAGDIATVAKKKEALETKNKTLEATIGSLKRDNATLSRQVKDKNSELSNSQKEESKKQQKIAELERQVAKANEEKTEALLSAAKAAQAAAKTADEQRAALLAREKAERLAREEAVRRARGKAEGAAGADPAEGAAGKEEERRAREEAGETGGDPRKKGNKDPTSVQKPLEDMRKIIQTKTTPDQYKGRMQVIAKHLRDYFYQSGEEIQPPTEVKPILDELQTKIQEMAPKDKGQQVLADLSIIHREKIDTSSAEELGAGLYLLLNRLVTYDNILDDVSKNNIQNIQFKDNGTESNGIYMALPHNDRASPDAIKTLKNMYKFCRLYGVMQTFINEYDIDNRITITTNYNEGMQALLREIKNNDEKTAHLIDHIFNVGITKTKSDDEMNTLFENQFKIQQRPESSNGKIRASRTQYTSTSVPNQLTCANKSKQIYASHARYTPQPAMETASEQAYEGAFPVHFVPVGIPSAHFSSGYMY